MSTVCYYGVISVMSEKKPVKRKQPVYKYRTNAVHVTVHSPTGETIPAAVRKEIEDSVFNVAFKNKLLINIALT